MVTTGGCPQVRVRRAAGAVNLVTSGGSPQVRVTKGTTSGKCPQDREKTIRRAGEARGGRAESDTTSAEARAARRDYWCQGERTVSGETMPDAPVSDVSEIDGGDAVREGGGPGPEQSGPGRRGRFQEPVPWEEAAQVQRHVLKPVLNHPGAEFRDLPF